MREHKEGGVKHGKVVKKEDPIIVQSYISNPYLINGYKVSWEAESLKIVRLSSFIFQFDFRIYVLVTSMNPLRIYLYKNGLVRFATEKFSVNNEGTDKICLTLDLAK